VRKFESFSCVFIFVGINLASLATFVIFIIINFHSSPRCACVFSGFAYVLVLYKPFTEFY
jgi:hypothetical protein